MEQAITNIMITFTITIKIVVVYFLSLITRKMSNITKSKATAKTKKQNKSQTVAFGFFSMIFGKKINIANIMIPKAIEKIVLNFFILISSQVCSA